MQTIEKANIDWTNLGFGYYKTDKRFVSMFKDGKWDEGQLTDDENITMNECACVLQYAQTCFEGMRFFDLRRWTTDLSEINKPVHMASIVKNEDGTFTYDLSVEVEPRLFKSAYLPIPYEEMLRLDNLVQNEGWDSWK